MSALKWSVSPAVDEAQWSAQLEALQGPIFHSVPWARYVTAGHPNIQPEYCSLCDSEGRTRGVALVFRHASRNPVLRRLTAQMYSDSLPWVEGQDPVLFSAFVERLEAHARESGVVELTIGSFGTPGHRAELERLGYDLKDRYEFVLPLDRTDEEMRSAMERRRRRTIQKAIDAGVSVETLEYEEGIVELRRLQQLTGERLKLRGAVVAFDPVRPPGDDSVKELVRAGCADLVGARYQGRLISISLYTRMNGLVYSTLAGHAPEAYDLNAYTLLLWTIMRRYREEGQRRLNIGGVPASASEQPSPDYGLYSYKIGLGGIREECTSAAKILRPMQHRLYQQARGIARQ